MSARGCNPCAAVKAWNDRHVIGEAVRVRLDDGREVETTTRSRATVLGGRAVVWLAGFSGCHLLDRVTAIEQDAKRCIGCGALVQPGEAPACGH
jgi:hypothetical protein